MLHIDWVAKNWLDPARAWRGQFHDKEDKARKKQKIKKDKKHRWKAQTTDALEYPHFSNTYFHSTTKQMSFHFCLLQSIGQLKHHNITNTTKSRLKIGNIPHFWYCPKWLKTLWMDIHSKRPIPIISSAGCQASSSFIIMQRRRYNSVHCPTHWS